MQDPGHGVAQQLQNHVHLISGHRFPAQPSLSIEAAFRYLLDAPTIVKQTAPMSWSYIQGPQDGTVWLEWIPHRNGEFRFPSDGYIWADPEQTYRQDFGGYTVEIMVHTLGYRPQFDQVAAHARTRYHLIHKAPNVNAAPPDPSLWIVHYHQAEQNRMMPAGQIPISPQMRHILNERRILESQGRIERKDFMLHDREHWPTITMPGMQQQMQHPGMYSNPMMQQQRAQQPFPPNPYQQGNQPPAKRARHSGPNVMPGSSEGVHDTSIEDEENTSLGDFFDHLSPREISMARYMQHHQWMEEVFSSPYASSRIVPTDLGMGLMGELKGLTDGILEPPSVEEGEKAAEKPTKAKDAQPFTNLKKEQVDEFNRRVEKHLEDGQAEIERMKKEHAEKMAEWKKTKALMQAEKRLRQATWEGHEDAVPTYRLEMPETNGQAENGAPTENVDDVVKDVERTLGVKIRRHSEATMVEKGGLEDQPRHELQLDDNQDHDREMSGMHHGEPTMSGPTEAAAEGQPGYGQQLPPTTDNKAQALQPHIPSDVPQPTFHGQEGARDQAPTSTQQSMPGAVPGQQGLDGLGSVDMGDSGLIDGMDMDVDGGIDFIEHTPVATPAGATDQPSASAPAPALQASENATSHAASPVTLGGASEQSTSTPQPPQQPATTATQDPQPASVMPTESAIGDLGEHNPDIGNSGDNGMFDDGTFDDLTNMGGEGGGDDGLLGFDGGGMMESAFGDALHGMDTHTPREDGQGGS